MLCLFFFSSRRRHTRSLCDWSSDVCSSDLAVGTRDQMENEFLCLYIDLRSFPFSFSDYAVSLTLL